jgi:galactokinase
VAEKLPHEELPQVTDHFTPPFALSLLTTAIRLAVALTTSDVGGVGVRATEIGGGGAVIVIVAEAVFVPSATDVAVTVTVAGLGTALGAV